MIRTLLLIVILAIAPLWAISYWHPAVYFLEPGHLLFANGKIVWVPWPPELEDLKIRYRDVQGFVWLHPNNANFVDNSLLFPNTTIPLWPASLLFVPWFVLHRRARELRCRRRAGACLACGYDLKGNVSGTCPECGEPCVVAS